MPESCLRASQNMSETSRSPIQVSVPELRSASPPSTSARLASATKTSTNDATKSVECHAGGLPAPGGTESASASASAAAAAEYTRWTPTPHSLLKRTFSTTTVSVMATALAAMALPRSGSAIRGPHQSWAFITGASPE